MPPEPIIIDERFMDEWLDFGWAELISYLTKYWRFQEWCDQHDRDYDSGQAA